MRPTLLNCRDPSQKTPEFITPEVDYKEYKSISFLSCEERFKNERYSKGSGQSCFTGPGSYEDLQAFKQLVRIPCNVDMKLPSKIQKDKTSKLNYSYYGQSLKVDESMLTNKQKQNPILSKNLSRLSQLKQYEQTDGDNSLETTIIAKNYKINKSRTLRIKETSLQYPHENLNEMQYIKNHYSDLNFNNSNYREIFTQKQNSFVSTKEQKENKFLKSSSDTLNPYNNKNKQQFENTQIIFQKKPFSRMSYVHQQSLTKDESQSKSPSKIEININNDYQTHGSTGSQIKQESMKSSDKKDDQTPIMARSIFDQHRRRSSIDANQSIDVIFKTKRGVSLNNQMKQKNTKIQIDGTMPKTAINFIKMQKGLYQMTKRN